MAHFFKYANRVMHKGSAAYQKREAVGESMRKAGLAVGNGAHTNERPLADRQKYLLERLAKHKSDQRAKYNLKAKEKRGSAIQKALDNKK